jgi:hypothetical protein
MRTIINGSWWVLTAMFFIAGCGTAVRSMQSNPASQIEPLRSIVLDSDVTDFCLDGPRLLLLENSGTRVIAWDTGFAAAETIPVSSRVYPARGIYADRYYIYVYDERTLYRIPKDNYLLSPWLNNVRVAGIAGYAPAEVLVSDEERQRVWLKTMFGESRVFLDRADVNRPGALTAFPGGVYGVISEHRRLLKVNRAGIVLRSIPLPQPVDMLAADEQGRAFLMRRGVNFIYLITENGSFFYILNGVVNPVALRCLAGRIFILDNGRRIVIFPVPGR